ncbi:hypothetical protein AHMF7616_01977 [Adhaeribacter pallidiroseus]|uniref:Uncharacterized protein n=1 Tax=Adhaeribacter pallidiroseus TaxID=2072847 RepID=A0A369QF89_9BACT|nr:hypothetical protein AHMF7616_01977 [Adhaeribacter pallidiroseus]
MVNQFLSSAFGYLIKKTGQILPGHVFSKIAQELVVTGSNVLGFTKFSFKTF